MHHNVDAEGDCDESMIGTLTLKNTANQENVFILTKRSNFLMCVSAIAHHIAEHVGKMGRTKHGSISPAATNQEILNRTYSRYRAFARSGENKRERLLKDHLSLKLSRPKYQGPSTDSFRTVLPRVYGWGGGD